MRLLTFSPNASSYRILYQALLAPGMPLTVADLGAHVATVRKFEAIGEDAAPKPAGPLSPIQQAAKYYVAPDGGSVELEEGEYEMLKTRLEGSVGQFNPQLSAEVLGALDWLKSSPKLTAAEVVAAGKPAES